MKNCRLCGSEITEAMIEAKRKQKSDRIKAAKKGQGAPRRYDYEAIQKLLREGKTIKETAQIIGCSTWPVQVAKHGINLEHKGE